MVRPRNRPIRWPLAARSWFVRAGSKGGILENDHFRSTMCEQIGGTCLFRGSSRCITCSGWTGAVGRCPIGCYSQIHIIWSPLGLFWGYFGYDNWSLWVHPWGHFGFTWGLWECSGGAFPHPQSPSCHLDVTLEQLRDRFGIALR